MSRSDSSTSTGVHFELGLFGANGTGISLTRVPERWSPTWENNRALALAIEKAGMEFNLPFSRWKGLGGASNPQHVTHDTITWAAGLLAVTHRLTVFATIQSPQTHPIVAAKQIATLDQIGPGRVALNVVSGWNQDEFTMFGMEQREHDTRYEYSREWLDVTQRMWAEDGPFDYKGTFFELKDLTTAPRPKAGKVPLMSAGFSKAGRRFAIERCDRLFTVMVSPEMSREEVAECKATAAQMGRKLDIYTTAVVVCRPTRRQAEEYHDYFAREMADWEATDHLMDLLGMHSQTFAPEHYKMYRDRFAGAYGNYLMIGDPDHVADEIRRTSEAGFRGLAVVFVNYGAEFPYFRDEVIPRLEAMGVRRRVTPIVG